MFNKILLLIIGLIIRSGYFIWCVLKKCEIVFVKRISWLFGFEFYDDWLSL